MCWLLALYLVLYIDTSIANQEYELATDFLNTYIEEIQRIGNGKTM